MYEDVTSESVKAGENYVKEAIENLPLFADERHSVIEYLIDLEECSSIQALKQKLKLFLAKFQADARMGDWIQRVKARRFLFCPNWSKWHVIVVVDTTGFSQAQIGSYFDFCAEIGFDTAKHIKTTAGISFVESAAEAQGCIRVLDQNFNDHQYKEYNLDRVAKYLATHIN